MPEFDVANEVQSALPALLAKMRESIAARVEARTEEIVMGEISNAVREWAAKNLIPEIIAQLDTGKHAIVKQAVYVADGIGEALKEALVRMAAKALQDNYCVKEIAEKLFRGY